MPTSRRAVVQGDGTTIVYVEMDEVAVIAQFDALREAQVDADLSKRRGTATSFREPDGKDYWIEGSTVRGELNRLGSSVPVWAEFRLRLDTDRP